MSTLAKPLRACAPKDVCPDPHCNLMLQQGKLLAIIRFKKIELLLACSNDAVELRDLVFEGRHVLAVLLEPLLEVLHLTEHEPDQGGQGGRE